MRYCPYTVIGYYNMTRRRNREATTQTPPLSFQRPCIATAFTKYQEWIPTPIASVASMAEDVNSWYKLHNLSWLLSPLLVSIEVDGEGEIALMKTAENGHNDVKLLLDSNVNFMAQTGF